MTELTPQQIEAAADRARAGAPGVLVIDEPALVRLTDVGLDRDSTDEDIDAAIAQARKAGHGWGEIEPILHACKLGSRQALTEQR